MFLFTGENFLSELFPNEMLLLHYDKSPWCMQPWALWSDISCTGRSCLGMRISCTHASCSSLEAWRPLQKGFDFALWSSWQPWLWAAGSPQRQGGGGEAAQLQAQAQPHRLGKCFCLMSGKGWGLMKNYSWTPTTYMFAFYMLLSLDISSQFLSVDQS